MSGPVVVVGAGGHGRELVDVARAAGFEVVGVVATDPPDPGVLERLGTVWLGGDDRLDDLGASHILGLGYPDVRAAVDADLVARGLGAATLIHPAAVIGTDVHLGDGVVVTANAVITTNVVLGRHTHIGVGSVVSHDCRLGDHVTLAPGVSMSGDVTVGNRVFIGVGAVVVPGCVIGDDAVIAAGAVVVGDVPAGVTARGVPARW
jgi:sugar O-acyltransferase (sialic acid O-acetyltransferase NeuD family)